MKNLNNIIDDKIYKEFMCYDRVVYYILKNCFNIRNMELLFIDRYMGFYQKNGEWINILDGMSRFLKDSGIVKELEIDINELSNFFSKNINNTNNKVVTIAKFYYPDDKNPYPYYSYLIIEKCYKEYAVLTKLSNVDQKICFNESIKNLYDILDQKPAIKIFVFNESIAKKCIPSGKIELEVKEVLKNCFMYKKEQLTEIFNESSDNTTIINNANTHLHKRDEYVANGVKRSEYSSFARRIHEMLFASFQCYEYLKLRKANIPDNLDNIKNKLEEHMTYANRHILTFIWTKEIDIFDLYYNEMLLVNTLVKEYRNEFQKIVIEYLT